MTTPITPAKVVAGADALARGREHWLQRADHEQKGLPGSAHGFVAALRERGRSALDARGLPSRRDDDWKYTSLAGVADVPWGRGDGREGATVPASALLDDSVRRGPTAVFVNGIFEPRLSRLQGLPRGVRVLPLVAALAEAPALLESTLGQVARVDAHGLAGLNAALFRDGAVVLLEAGAVLEAPLSLVFVGLPLAASAGSAVVRNLVIAGEGATGSVLEHHLSLPGAWMTSAVTEVSVAPGAKVVHYEIEEESPSAFHVGAVEARVERDGRFESHLVTVGGGLTRREARTVLAGPGAECVVNGLYMPRVAQHLDCFTSIEHRVPHGTSRQLYKGVIADDGRGVWTGRVLVAENAQKTSALQTNMNLLLSEKAHVDTRPQLEIYADDVKCSHGATVGRLDADALFYLRTRGIDEAAARGLLTFAFVAEVVAAMPFAPLRQSLERALATGLLGNEEVVG
jgi:Fe-S cluster assembly protein SufD